METTRIASPGVTDAKASSAVEPVQRRRPLLLIGAVTVTLVLVAGSVVLWRTLRVPTPPPPGADVPTIVAFVANDDFFRIDENQKCRVGGELRKRSSELDQALRSGKVTQAQYERASLAVWMVRQLDHMDAYYALPEASRKQHLIEEHAQKAKTPRTGPTLSDSAQRHFVERWSAKWPPERQEQWETYREAVKKVKAGATTRPG